MVRIRSLDTSNYVHEGKQKASSWSKSWHGRHLQEYGLEALSHNSKWPMTLGPYGSFRRFLRLRLGRHRAEYLRAYLTQLILDVRVMFGAGSLIRT